MIKELSSEDIDLQALGDAGELMYVCDAELGYNERTIHEQQAYLERRLMDDQIFMLLARHLADQKYVGFGLVSFFPDRENVTLGMAYVLPKYRRQGIFGLIVQGLDTAAITRGIKRIYAYPTNDGRSLRVLERNGYIRLPNTTDGIDLVKDFQ